MSHQGPPTHFGGSSSNPNYSQNLGNTGAGNYNEEGCSHNANSDWYPIEEQRNTISPARGDVSIIAGNNSASPMAEYRGQDLYAGPTPYPNPHIGRPDSRNEEYGGVYDEELEEDAEVENAGIEESPGGIRRARMLQAQRGEGLQQPLSYHNSMQIHDSGFRNDQVVHQNPGNLLITGSDQSRQYPVQQPQPERFPPSRGYERLSINPDNSAEMVTEAVQAHLHDQIYNRAEGSQRHHFGQQQINPQTDRLLTRDEMNWIQSHQDPAQPDGNEGYPVNTGGYADQTGRHGGAVRSYPGNTENHIGSYADNTRGLVSHPGYNTGRTGVSNYESGVIPSQIPGSSFVCEPANTDQRRNVGPPLVLDERGNYFQRYPNQQVPISSGHHPVGDLPGYLVMGGDDYVGDHGPSPYPSSHYIATHHSDSRPSIISASDQSEQHPRAPLRKEHSPVDSGPKYEDEDEPESECEPEPESKPNTPPPKGLNDKDKHAWVINRAFRRAAREAVRKEKMNMKDPKYRREEARKKKIVEDNNARCARIAHKLKIPPGPKPGQKKPVETRYAEDEE